MTLEALLVIFALLGAFLMVEREWLSADFAFMSALAVVTIGGVIEPTEAVEGFASTAIVALGSLYIVAAVIRRSGIVQRLVEHLPFDGSRLRALVVRPPASRLPGGGEQVEDGRQQSSSAVDPVFAVALLLGVTLFPLAGLLRFETAALLGAVAAVVTGRLPAEQARRTVDWEIVVVVGSIIGFSKALVASGLVETLMTLAISPAQLFGSSLSVAVVLTTLLVASAFANRRAAHSLIPLVLSTAIVLTSGIGV